MDRKEQLKNSTLYLRMQQVTQYMDRYYIDGVAGLIPGGIGDVVSGLFSLIHVYFSLFKLRSIPLTLAVLNNTLRDIFMGMLPFFVGDVIDFFHKANVKNMRLIDGFINNDTEIIHSVNKKAAYSFAVIIILALGIFALAYLLAWIIQNLGSLLA